MQRIPDDLFDAAASGDLDALWALDSAIAEHDLLAETLEHARGLMSGGDVGARFLTGWLSIDAGRRAQRLSSELPYSPSSCSTGSCGPLSTTTMSSSS